MTTVPLASKIIIAMSATPKEFIPLAGSMSEIRACVPSRLFQRSTIHSTAYLLRDIFLAAILWWSATFIDAFFSQTKGIIALVCYASCWFT